MPRPSNAVPDPLRNCCARRAYSAAVRHKVTFTVLVLVFCPRWSVTSDCCPGSFFRLAARRSITLEIFCPSNSYRPWAASRTKFAGEDARPGWRRGG
jgi:hypothetical protein